MKSIIVFVTITLLVSQCLATQAYCTYHMYYATEPLTDVACSDGASGLINWGYTNLQPMFPYVMAWDQLKWNDSKCGTCIALTYNGKTIHLTALDYCGAGFPATHFDISKEAYYEIFGDEGVQKGHMMADWSIVQSSMCKGNKKKLGGETDEIVK
jgi:hypothetical protein